MTDFTSSLSRPADPELFPAHSLNGLRYHYQHSGSHGIIGSQLLAAGSHPPPQRGAGSYNDDLSMDREGSVDSSGSGGY